VHGISRDLSYYYPGLPCSVCVPVQDFSFRSPDTRLPLRCTRKLLRGSGQRTATHRDSTSASFHELRHRAACCVHCGALNSISGCMRQGNGTAGNTRRCVLYINSCTMTMHERSLSNLQKWAWGAPGTRSYRQSVNHSFNEPQNWQRIGTSYRRTGLPFLLALAWHVQVLAQSATTGQEVPKVPSDVAAVFGTQLLDSIFCGLCVPARFNLNRILFTPTTSTGKESRSITFVLSTYWKPSPFTTKSCADRYSKANTLIFIQSLRYFESTNSTL
jgi:hypothetical protein